jgi:hypothetical protein
MAAATLAAAPPDNALLHLFFLYIGTPLVLRAS